MKKLSKYLIISIGLYAPLSMADTANTAQILVQNLGTLAVILQTIAVISGVGLFIGGLFKLKKYGESRTYMSQQVSIAGALMMLLSGIVLLLFPMFIDTALWSFWGNASPESDPLAGSASGWGQYVPAILMFVRIIGVGAFMRGVVMASKVGSGQSQPGTMGKVIVYMFAGVLCVHIVGTIQLIESFFGFSFGF